MSTSRTADLTTAPGETSGTDTREPRPMRERLLTFSLADELTHLRDEPQWQEGERNSRTLAKHVDLRVVLTTLRAGAGIEERDGDGRVTLQVLEGEAELAVEDGVVTLGTGRLATLDSGAPWRLTATSEAAILLTLAWPEEKAFV
jgi:quercetin dioxygenase-like cupin family protein